uniref:Uncharacterized protein n=1 Tax=Arundo donax TaxID=35708 RepID=A0A0A9CYG4_ARUDO
MLFQLRCFQQKAVEDANMCSSLPWFIRTIGECFGKDEQSYIMLKITAKEEQCTHVLETLG